MNDDQLLKDVKKIVTEKISPILQMDGGNIEVIELEKTEKGYNLKAKLMGACQGCPGATMTLQYLVQDTIDKEFPDKNIKVVADM
ncbi:NifU family protein [Patescibacteria group bacterium]|nr:NifU family protein [Patescibacteria group bacterium]